MNLERKLVPFEKGLEILNRTASSLNVVTTSKVKGYIGQDSLKNALLFIEQRHPQLQSCISGSINELEFSKRANSPLPLQVLEYQDTASWQKIVLDELNQEINSSESLFRITAIYQLEKDYTYLITTIHHAIIDGISSVNLHSEILSHCGNSQQIKISSSKIENLPILPPVESLFPDSHTGYQGKINGIIWLLKLLLKQIWLQPKTLKFEKFVPVEARTCNVIYKTLEPAFTQALLSKCRAENTTIQGALCSAMLLSVYEKIKTEKSHKESICCRSYVDLRRRLSPAIDNEKLGSFASAVSTFHNINSQTEFWQLAREVKYKVIQGINRGDMFNIILMFTEVLNALLSSSHKAPLAVEVTNLGQVDIPVNYGSLKLEEISFMPSQGVFGGVFFAAVTTLKDKMMLNFVFSEPSLSQATVEDLVNNTMSYLIRSFQ